MCVACEKHLFQGITPPNSGHLLYHLVYEHDVILLVNGLR